MKAEELRIGNLVNFHHNNKLRQGWVTTINHRGKCVVLTFDNFKGNFPDFSMTQGGETHSVKPCNIEPIPLTEEMWENLGFKWDNKRCNYDNGKIIYTRWNHPDYLINEDSDNEINIEFVHQLQNLHFALTGEELTIKE